MAQPIITIVIPVRNRADLVEATLDSVVGQEARPLRLIVVDNGSTDATPAVLEAWAARHAVPDFAVSLLREPRPGAAAARNRGLREVRSPWVLFFDSDDVMLPGHISRALAAIASHPEADVVGWSVGYCFDDGSRRVCDFSTADAEWQNLFHGSMATQRWCARTELVRRAGGWDDAVPFWNDIELGARILALRPTLRHTDSRVLVGYRAHADSITGASAADGLSRMEPALTRIARTLGAERASWVRLKRIIQIGTAARTDSAAARPYRDAFFAERGEPLRRRLLWRFAYLYTRLGLRGMARLARPFLR